jgi:hypothetical protein
MLVKSIPSNEFLEDLRVVSGESRQLRLERLRFLLAGFQRAGQLGSCRPLQVRPQLVHGPLNCFPLGGAVDVEAAVPPGHHL